VGLWIGVSTHTEEQVRAAGQSEADYVAVGPVFATDTKRDPEPVVGLELVTAARRLTRKPVVAIGGITAERAGEVYEAGADCIAVARDLILHSDPARRAREYFRAAAKRN
jgi:thiamine-phosphate pyrophosphorylase